MDRFIEKWVSKIYEVQIGATKQDGGTRSKTVKVGGQSTLPFLKSEGKIPNLPAIALEVWDIPPEEEWPSFNEKFKEITNNPIEWAKKAKEYDADLICLKLVSCHPDKKNNSGDYAADLVKKILQNTDLPLIVIGCGNIEKDSEILACVSDIAKGEKLLLGMAVKENYKTISAVALAGGHSIIAETPLDINLAKQLNILISDVGLPLERIVMHHTTGGLGYGFEYCYSIMERCRLAGLQGDKTISTPIINMIGQETWKTKEAKATIIEEPSWGDLEKRSISWEISCASGYLQAGSDILVLAHPESIKSVKTLISDLMG